MELPAIEGTCLTQVFDCKKSGTTTSEMVQHLLKEKEDC